MPKDGIKGKKGISNTLYIFFKFRELTIILFIIVLTIIITIRNPVFLSKTNISDILVDMVVLSILAVGQMLVILSGGIDLSLGTGLGLVAMITGLTIININMNPFLLLMIGALIGGLLGSLNGLLITRGGVVPLICTLGTGSIFRGITVIINSVFYKGQYIGSDKLPLALKNLTRTDIIGLPSIIFFMIVIYLIFYYFLNYTVTGREFYAVGGNIQAAKIAGIKSNNIQFLAYMISGVLFGIAAVLYVSRFTTAQTDTGVGMDFSSVTAVALGGVSLLGGMGSIIGVFFGSLLIAVINTSLNMIYVSPFWKLAINGIILLVAVVGNQIMENKVRKRLRESRRVF